MQLARVGQYRLEEQLGSGGMGIVYRAYDERLDRWVALKILRPDRQASARQRERFRREARASARISHPNVVQVYDILQADGIECIVMELIEGEPLSERLHRGPLEIGKVLALAREIVAALAEAHAQRIIHRDLKSENIIVTPDWRAKVVDFGIAKWLLKGAGEESLTATGSVLGTFRAMAPEQAEGREIDERADLFSFGTLLYEMATGCSPFLGPNELVTLQLVCHQRQRPAREVRPGMPEALSDLIDHLLQKDPALRPQSAREVSALLARIATGEDLLRGAPEPGQVSTLVDWPASQPTEERRQVTVLRCGLVGSGGLADEERLAAFRTLVTGVVEDLEGQIGPVAGGSLVAWFGAPRAHEDDARRAAHAALEIAARTAAGQAGVAAAVGIHTGMALVSWQDGWAAEPESLGTVDELAIGLLGRATAGGVLASEATCRLIEGFFDYEACAPVAREEGEEAARVYRVLAGRRTHSRAYEGEGLTPLIGRTLELDLLRDRWRLAQESLGQTVLLYGEAGIGKSRLLRELRCALSPGEADWVECHASPYHRHSVLQPFRELLGQWMGDDARLPPAERLDRLEKLVRGAGLQVEEDVPLLAALLSLPVGERYPPLRYSPEAQRNKVLDALLSLLVERAERRPLLMVVEDLHWIDPTSIELLGLLIARVPALPLLLVLSSRPELPSVWGMAALTRISLTPLTRQQTRNMIDGLAGAQDLSTSVRDQVIDRTDGVPLFIEELTKMVLESHLAPGEGTPIPSTLEGWLMARLDRLGTAREVAQWAAAIGREVSGELLRRILPFGELLLDRELERLVQAEILYRRGFPPRVRYIFKHALLQDAAYASLAPGRRRICHERIAETLEADFPEIAESQPELLAHHFSEAGLTAKAVRFWRRAGDRALQSAANHETVEHVTRGLAVLATLPEGAGRDSDEIGLQVALGIAEGQVRGYAQPRVAQAFARAWELSRGTGAMQLFPTLRGLYVSSIMGCQPRRAVEIGNRLLELAGEDPALAIVSHQSIGLAHMMCGSFPQARPPLEKVLELCGPDVSLPDAHLPGSGDSVVEALCGLSWTLWFLGEPDTALRTGRRALELASRRSYPFTLLAAIFFLSRLQILCRDLGEIGAWSERLLELAEEKRILMARSPALVLQGCLLAEEGKVDEGIRLLREGIEAGRSAGFLSSLSMSLVFLAEWQLRAGQAEEGLAAIEEGFALAAVGGQHYCDAELLRLRAELSRLQGAPLEQVEEQLRSALALAGEQGARSLELRAAISLSRLWVREGREAEALSLLSGIYGEFEEGLETGDLREARELLRGLSPGSAP